MPSTLLRPYYYGQYRYDNYLLDATEAIEANTKVQREGLKQQRQTTDLLYEQHEEALAQQAAAEAELAAIHDAITDMTEGLREEMQWGFSLVVDRMDDQISLFSKAVSELEGIRDMLKAPRATEATELFEHGEYCFQQGFYDDALDAYLKAEQITKVNYLLQFRIGTLYLEGCNRSCNVIDLPKAEAHLLLAIRYAEVDSKTDCKAKKYVADAYFRAGKAAYFIGEQSNKSADHVALRVCLERALNYFGSSLRLWPEYTATLYWQAKCHALLGDAQKAIRQFEILSDRNRKYYAQAMEDGDFRNISGQIEAIFRDALQNPGPNARAAESKLAGIDQLLNWAEGIEHLCSRVGMSATKHSIEVARRDINSMDVDFDGLLPQIDKARAEMEGTFEGMLTAKKKSLNDMVASHMAMRAELDSTVSSARDQMSQTQGSGGVGCLVGFIALFAFIEIGMRLIALIALRETLIKLSLSTARHGYSYAR